MEDCSNFSLVLSFPEEDRRYWAEASPMRRLAEVHELRGVMTWLASDASSFCTGSEYVHIVCLN